MSKPDMYNFQNTLYIYIYIYIYITHNELRHAHLIYKQTYTVEKYVHLDMQPLTRCTKRIL